MLVILAAFVMLWGVSRSGIDVRIWVLEAKFCFCSSVAPETLI